MVRPMIRRVKLFVGDNRNKLWMTWSRHQNQGPQYGQARHVLHPRQTRLLAKPALLSLWKRASGGFADGADVTQGESNVCFCAFLRRNCVMSICRVPQCASAVFARAPKDQLPNLQDQRSSSARQVHFGPTEKGWFSPESSLAALPRRPY